MTHWHRPMRREPPLVPLPKKVPPIGPELPPPIDPTTPIPTALPSLISSAAFDVWAVTPRPLYRRRSGRARCRPQDQGQPRAPFCPHASRGRQDGVAADLVSIR